MNLCQLGVITLLLFGVVIGLTGIVCADPGVNATPEIQSLGTTTSADVVGLVMESDAGTWTLTNDPRQGYIINLDGAGMDSMLAADYNQLIAAGGSFKGIFFIPSSLLNVPTASDPTTTWGDLVAWLIGHGATATLYGGGIHTGALDPGQVQYTTAYDASIVAQGGQTSFVKSMNLHTGNKVISQSNLDAKTGLAFAATSGGGNVVGSENLMLDGAGMNTNTSDRMLCPFAAGIANVIPAYCNIVQAGSMFDLTIGSVTTNANNRFISSDATNPVVLNYDISVKPYSTTQGQVPASGSTSAYIKAHLQEARGNGTAKAEDVVYSETSSASGRITAFNKLMSYSSQVTSPTTVNHVIHASVGRVGAFSGNGHTAFISPMGDIQVPEHTSITFTMGTTGSNSGRMTTVYGPASVEVDGVDQGDINSFTFQDVTSDHTIVARPYIPPPQP